MNQKRVRGFTLIELMIVVAIIGLLAAIAIPNFMQAIDKSRRTACQANLKHIQSAKLEWALDFRKGATDTPQDQELFGPGKYLQAKPTCGSGGTYSICSVESAATCNITSHTL